MKGASEPRVGQLSPGSGAGGHIYGGGVSEPGTPYGVRKTTFRNPESGYQIERRV